MPSQVRISCSQMEEANCGSSNHSFSFILLILCK